MPNDRKWKPGFIELRADVYRAPIGWGDCTNGGPSSRYETMTLYFEGHVEQGGDDVLVLVDHKHGLRAIPHEFWVKKRWTMFGGNFVYASDCRFPSLQPVKIFDRVEGAGA